MDHRPLPKALKMKIYKITRPMWTPLMNRCNGLDACTQNSHLGQCLEYCKHWKVIGLKCKNCIDILDLYARHVQIFYDNLYNYPPNNLYNYPNVTT